MIASPHVSWRLRFSLRTMFALALIVALPCAWIGHSLKWINERRETFDNANVFDIEASFWNIYSPPTRAPGGLWLLGESGHGGIRLRHRDESAIQRIRRLFPEANIYLAPDRYSRFSIHLFYSPYSPAELVDESFPL